jgi:hypothetical protein
VEEAIDEHRPGLLVELVFDRLAALRDLDDDIDVVRRPTPDRDFGDIHCCRRRC